MESSMDEESVCAFAMHVVTASVLPAILRSAIELDLLELIKKAGPASSAQLAAQIPTTNPEAPGLLDRILRLLAANDILECTLRTLPHGGGVERLYSLSPVCKYFTRNEDGVSLAPLLLMGEDKVFMDSWYHLKDTIVEGGLIPFNRAHGMNLFEYLRRDPRVSKIFNQAMYEESTMFMKGILEIYKGFEGVQTLVDVGGGTGASLNMIISKYPFIKGINYDLPNVIQYAPTHPGVEHVSGDMFVSVPRGDVIFMKAISHNWSDELVLKVFKNCHEALPENGKLIMADIILPEIPKKDMETSLEFALDLIMLAYNPGAKERTEVELQTLAKASGFKQFRKVCCCLKTWIIELYK